MGFQKIVYQNPGRGVAGDFASTNPRSAMLAGEGALVAAETLTVGYFGFADMDAGEVFAAHDAGLRVGFIHRNNQGTVHAGQEATMTIGEGREVALFVTGDFYAILDDDCVVGDAITATKADGSPSVTAAGTDHVATSFIAAETKAAGELVKITTFGA